MANRSALRLLSTLLTLPALASAQIQGSATFTGNESDGGTCSLTNYSLPDNVFGTGIGPSNWAGGGKCGSCLQVTGPLGSTTVMVVDSCPSCDDNRLNLAKDAFTQIADEVDGIIDVEFDVTSCGITTPLVVRNKVGTSEYFFSLQVLNSNYPVTDLEVSIDGQTWESTVIQDYNYYEREDKSGFGEETVSVRVSCSNGNQVIIPSVAQVEGEEVVAPVNC